MEAQDDTIVHFERLGHFARALAGLPAQILEHNYSYESFGSWYVVVRYKGLVSQVVFDGRDRHLGLRRTDDRKPPYRYGSEGIVESGIGAEALDAEVIEKICHAITE